MCVGFFCFNTRLMMDNASLTESVEFQEGSTCKRYRFVVTGHGKYEKVPIEGCEDTNSPSGKTRNFKSNRVSLLVAAQYPENITEFIFKLKIPRHLFNLTSCWHIKKICPTMTRVKILKIMPLQHLEKIMLLLCAGDFF